MVFVSEPNDKKSELRRAKEVNAVIPAIPKYLNWSEQQIGWSRADNPKVMPNPGTYALVVDPTLVGPDRKSTRLNSSHSGESRMPSSA